MIELNKNKLIPGVDTSWGDITGDISKQSDLMSTLSSYATESWVSGKNYLTASSLKTINNQSIVGSGNINIEASVPDYYATKAWVSEQGYLTSETLPSDLATESWVSSQGYITSEALSGFATESWVSSQGYLTSVPDTFATKAWVSEQGYLTSETLPSDLATESWVSSQGYLTSTSLKTINSQSLVGEGDIEIGGLTPEQESAIEPLEETSNGVLYTRELQQYKYQRLPVNIDQNNEYNGYLYNIDGDIYEMPFNSLFKMNPDNFEFELVGYFNGDHNTGAPLWKDHTGRMYNGVTKQLNFNTLEIETVDLECSDYASIFSNNCDSLWKTETGIYNIGYNGVSKFDEELKKFVSWNVTVTQGYNYGEIAPYIAQYGLWYGEHYVWFNSEYMFEMTEYDDHIDISVLNSPYFPIEIDGSGISSQFVHYIDGVLYYLKEYNYYKLVNGSWTVISDFQYLYISYWQGRGVIYDDYLMIGFENDYVYGTTTLINMSDTKKLTYWAPTNQVSVDLTSRQTITGDKTFRNSVVFEGNVNIKQVNTFDGSTNIYLGKNTTSATNIKLDVPGEFSVNNKNIATTEDCILNRTILPYGGKEVNVISNDSRDPYKYYYFTTNTGRLFNNNNGTDYEFDGTQWNSVSPLCGGNQVYGPNVVQAGSKTFFVSGITYLWDDTNSVFTQIVNTAPTNGWYIWPCGDGELRASGSYKLVENNGVWSWEEDTVPDYKYGMTYYVNGHIYVLSLETDYVYEYNESTKTYTELGHYHRWSDASFVCGGDILFAYNGTSYYKIDLSLVGVSDYYIDTLTDIPYYYSDYFYGEYNNKLYYCPEYGKLNYCYGIEEELPEVPASNGTYVLKAVRTNSGVTYSWVAE